MGKAKKGRKNKQEDDFSDEEVNILDTENLKSNKNKQAVNEEETEVATDNSNQTKKSKKAKKKKKVESESDDDNEPDMLKGTIDSDEDVLPVKTNKLKNVPKKSAFCMLDFEDEDIDTRSTSEEEEEEVEAEKVEKEVEKPAQQPNKSTQNSEKPGKGKKKNRKKAIDDEEDIDKLMAELELEYNGGKVETASKNDGKSEPIVVPETGKEDKDDVKDVGEPTVDVSEKEETPPVKDEENDESTGTVKTAAQKRKEKKEREKQKKMIQKTQEKNTKVKSTAVEGTDEPTVEEKPIEDEALQEENEEDGKKKKKKKKGEEKVVEDKKKKPGKKQLLAMQEALKELEREKEKARLEEIAQMEAAEEAENVRLEKLRIEQEKKERKKQKEKEKKERLKAEGKLLTKAQKQAKARAEASLQALREQGFEVPSVGDKKTRPKYTNKKKAFKKKDSVEDDASVSTNDVEKSKDQIEAMKTSVVEIKDSWDASDGEENANSKQESPEKENIDEDVEDVSDSESDSESEPEVVEEVKHVHLPKETPAERIQRRKDEAEKNIDYSKLRSPIVCVLGHVDTGKTKILDKIRRTNVQDGEAGGITQQIGATMIPGDVLQEQCKMVKGFTDIDLQIPGLLVIDTPGHESFSNLRSRGSSLCDIAILVVDIMHGLEPQTIESINLLKQRKTPFVIALNKVDRLYEWKPSKSRDVQDTVKNQARNTSMEFNERCKEVIVQFAEQGLNAKLFYENDDPRRYLSLIPTSAATGDGMGNLLGLIVELTQTMLAKKLSFSNNLQATVLEVKAIPGLGTTIDVILINGKLKEGDTIVVAGVDGPVVTQIRSLLMPQPMRELRVKNPYTEFKEIEAAQGIKIAGKDLDKAIAGLNMLIAHQPDEIDILREEVSEALTEVMQSIKLADRGVYVQASTLGSLEALLEFLRTSEIPYAGVRIGPVVKKDVIKASIMLEHDKKFAVILAFDVKIERDAQEMADSTGVKIFSADIIYHLFDSFTAYCDNLKKKKREEFRQVAVFPCKLRVLPQFIFNARDPIVVGVSVEAGVVKEGTPICVPSQEFVQLGIITTLEINHKQVESAKKGQEICIKIEPIPGEAPKLYGRHFDHQDMLVSKISRDSIDACKNYFRDDLAKSDWQLMVELKKLFEIL